MLKFTYVFACECLLDHFMQQKLITFLTELCMVIWILARPEIAMYLVSNNMIEMTTKMNN